MIAITSGHRRNYNDDNELSSINLVEDGKSIFFSSTSILLSIGLNA